MRKKNEIDWRISTTRAYIWPPFCTKLANRFVCETWILKSYKFMNGFVTEVIHTNIYTPTHWVSHERDTLYENSLAQS